MNDTVSSAGEPGTPTRRSLSSRILRALLALGLGLVLAFVATEVGFRFLLFSDSKLALKYGDKLRDPAAFCNSKVDSDYFKLRFLWKEAHQGNTSFPRRDARLGWVKDQILLPSLDHEHRKRSIGRRPFLMYGDSFTSCVIPQWDCWEGLIEKSALGNKVCVVNYGVRGYGVDQIKVLLDNSLDLWLDQKPVVAVGLLTDDDMDRVVFDFRGCPKPVFDLEDGALVAKYPGEFDIPQWVAEHPANITSYLVRYLTVGKKLLPKSFVPSQDPDALFLTSRKKEISRALIAEMRDRLEAADVDYFFVVFEGPFIKRPKGWIPNQTWRAPFLKETLDELQIPWVSSVRAVQKFQQERGDEGNAGYFIPDSEPAARHFTRLGNEAALEALMRGLHGTFDGEIRTMDRHPVRKGTSKPPARANETPGDAATGKSSEGF